MLQDLSELESKLEDELEKTEVDEEEVGAVTKKTDTIKRRLANEMRVMRMRK